MVSLAQKRFAGCLGSEHAGLALTPRSPSRPQCCATRRTTDLEKWMLRLSQTISHRVLAAALLSKLSRNVRSPVRSACRRPPQRLCRSRHRKRRSGPACHGGDTRTRTARPCPASSAIPARRAPGPECRSSRRSRLCDGCRRPGCGLVNLADVGAFGVKGRIGFWRQPVTKAMRFEVGLFFKKRPTERCETFGTRPRRIASSAISAGSNG